MSAPQVRPWITQLPLPSSGTSASATCGAAAASARPSHIHFQHQHFPGHLDTFPVTRTLNVKFPLPKEQSLRATRSRLSKVLNRPITSALFRVTGRTSSAGGGGRAHGRRTAAPHQHHGGRQRVVLQRLLTQQRKHRLQPPGLAEAAQSAPVRSSNNGK